MGGTGVASSHYGVAPLANPALLTKSGAKDDFSLLLPSVGAQLSDPGNIADNADKISDDWKAFDRAVDSHSGVPQTAARLKRDCRTSGTPMPAHRPGYLLWRPFPVIPSLLH
ncbi:hypothetical protein ECZU06_60840 [Escherichia coli]|nr:hypothetical protein ECZU06_60840 [Escherichia coli]